MLTICRYDEAETAARAQEQAAVLSLENPHCPNGEGKAPDLTGTSIPHLVLNFWDVEQACLHAPQPHHVANGMKFLRQHQEKHLVVHCTAGICRSTAFALAHIAERFGPGREHEAVEKLIEIRPIAAPNMRILAIADAVLAREGRIACRRALFDAALTHPHLQRRFHAVHDYRREWITKHAAPFKEHFTLPIDQLTARFLRPEYLR